MNILRFEMNVPKQVVLETPQGTMVEGRYGDRVMYRLVDGRVMYVPPIIKSRIEAQGIIPGEPFELCKTQIRNGQRRAIEWRLSRIQSEVTTDVALSKPIEQNDPPPNVEIEGDLRVTLPLPHDGQENWHHPVATCDPSIRRKARVELPDRPNGDANARQNGHDVSCQAAASLDGNATVCIPDKVEEEPDKTPPSPTTKLEHALKTAISAAHNAEKYGSELGYVVRFDADAIKSMAITVLINMAQGPRR